MEKKEVCKQKVPAWMVTFSDLTTLLLVFFVMLLASGEAKKIKTYIILSSFEGKLGFLSGGQSLDEGEFENMGQSIEAMPSSRQMKSLNKSLNHAVSRIVEMKSNNRDIRVQENERGLVISLMTDVLFDPGRADLKLEENRELIENLRTVIDNLGTSNRVIFEGHADDHPIVDPRFKDQWDLSMQRAWSLLNGIESIPSIKPFHKELVAIKAFGDSRPMGDSKTPESVAFNRRVDIVITENGGQ